MVQLKNIKYFTIINYAKQTWLTLYIDKIYDTHLIPWHFKVIAKKIHFWKNSWNVINIKKKLKLLQRQRQMLVGQKKLTLAVDVHIILSQQINFIVFTTLFTLFLCIMGEGNLSYRLMNNGNILAGYMLMYIDNVRNKEQFVIVEICGHICLIA